MAIEFLLSILKGQIRTRLSYHHHLLCRRGIKKLCIPLNVLLYLQVPTRYGRLILVNRTAADFDDELRKPEFMHHVATLDSDS